MSRSLFKLIDEKQLMVSVSSRPRSGMKPLSKMIFEKPQSESASIGSVDNYQSKLTANPPKKIGSAVDRI